MGSQHTAVYYNGVQLGNAQNGQVDLGRFSLDNMEEIQLYNGQKSDIFQSAREFGSAGNVYLTTRKPYFKDGEKVHVHGKMRFGSFALANPNVGVDVRLTDGLSLTIDAEYVYSNGKYPFRYRRVLRSTVFTLVVVAAAAILVATLWMPVLQIYGASMTPTLTDGDIVISRKVRNLKQGDIVAFYYNNRILVKRYIANAGDWVDIDEDGNVYVNGELLNEPYVYEKALGECNIELPYQVPENRIFVLGDHRSVSIDSRSTAVGCVAEDQIVGELVFCVWPFSNLGLIK
jgi:signal peptidase I